MKLSAAQSGVNKGHRIKQKHISCYDYFPKILDISRFSILIEFSYESKCNSVFKLIVAYQAKLLVLKHMKDPAQLLKFPINVSF